MASMAQRDAAGGDDAVCVAVHMRPLVAKELEEGCLPCLEVTPGEPQVGQGQHRFTYDHVFGEGGEDPSRLYGTCVLPLVDGLFKGYNATVSHLCGLSCLLCCR